MDRVVRPAVCAFVGVAVTVAFASAGASSALGSGWSIQPSPSVTGGLDDVSCVSRAVCTAVGGYAYGGLLAERWNGSGWSIQQTRDPVTQGVSGLRGVSCASKSACIAVGGVNPDASSAAFGALLGRWNGADWLIQASALKNPFPWLPAFGGMTSVSCVSPTACTAVGSVDFSEGDGVGYAGPVVKRWNGKRWSIQWTPSVLPVAVLAGVSCPSLTACTAVGSNGPHPAAEAWNGKKWSIQRIPTPAHVTDAQMTGVSCTSPTACTAVGIYHKAAGRQLLLAERWNGKKWSIQRLPGHGTLAGVSCGSPTVCTAVGEVSFDGPPLIERWTGTDRRPVG